MAEAEQAIEDGLTLLDHAKKRGVPIGVALFLGIALVYGTIWGADKSARIENLESNNAELKVDMKDVKRGNTVYQIWQKKEVQQQRMMLRAISERLGVIAFPSAIEPPPLSLPPTGRSHDGD